MDRKAKTSREQRLAAAKAWAEKKPSGFESRTIRLPDNLSMFRVERAGTRRLDFMPFLVSDEAWKKLTRDCKQSDPDFECYEQTYYVHRNIGPSSATFVCPRKTFGKPCPVCEHLAKNQRNDELYRSIGPKYRHLWALIDITDEESRKKEIQIWDTGHWKTFGEKLRTEINETNNYLWADSVEGMTLEVRFIEKSYNNKPYFEADKITLVPRKKQYTEKLAETTPKLCDFLIETSYEEMKSAFEEGVDATRDDDPEETPSSDSGVKPAAKPKTSPPVKEKVEEDDDDWLNDEEVTPAKTTKTEIINDDDDWDEDAAGDDEEEEEEDEPPVVKKRKNSR